MPNSNSHRSSVPGLTIVHSVEPNRFYSGDIKLMATKKADNKPSADQSAALSQGQSIQMFKLTAFNTVAVVTAYPGMEVGLAKNGWLFARPEPKVVPEASEGDSA